MTLQVHPIALGCMLVVAVGTLIYTYMTTRQQGQAQGYRSNRSNPYNSFDEPPDAGVSRTSSWTSLTEESGQSCWKKRNSDKCSICLGILKSSLKTLTCQHVFHDHCITMWLNSNTTCPLCRKEAHV